MHIGNCAPRNLNLGFRTKQSIPIIGVVDRTLANHDILSIIRSAICGTC